MAVSFPKYFVVKQEHPPVKDCYTIVETVWTSDGPRSRLCSGRWPTMQEAMEARDSKLKRTMM